MMKKLNIVLTILTIAVLTFGLTSYMYGAESSKKVVILCFDGVDGSMTEEFMSQGLLPNLKKLSEKGSYSQLDTTNPPQTPVSWAAFTTGWHPGKTEIFDFLKRNEGSYLPSYSQVTIISKALFLGKSNPLVFAFIAGGIIFLVLFFLLKAITKKKKLSLIIGISSFLLVGVAVFFMVRAWIPYETTFVTNNRKGTPFWDVLNDSGIKTKVFNIPVTFPAEGKKNGKLLAGLGVPDITGSIGKPAYFTSSRTFKPDTGEFTVEFTELPYSEDNIYYSFVKGPDRTKIRFIGDDGKDEEIDMQALGYLDEEAEMKTTPEYLFTNSKKTLIPDETNEALAIPMKISVDKVAKEVTIEIQGVKQTVKEGDWSDWYELEFQYSPLLSLWGVARFVVEETNPDLKLYLSPIHLHPNHTPVPITAPKSWAGDLFKKFGVYKTLGWAVDTWSLQEGLISENSFLEEAYYTRGRKEEMLYESLDNMEHKVHIQYFEYTDRIQHLFWRFIDKNHPYFDGKKAALYDKSIQDCYKDMDRIVGEVMKKIDDETTLFVISDHGFVSWRRAVNYNTWLAQNGYINFQAGQEWDNRAMELDDLFGNRSENFWPNVDWSKTTAYALGIGNIYLNRKDREPSGIIKDDEEYSRIRNSIVEDMPKLIDPETGMNPIVAVYKREDIWDAFDPTITPDLRVCTNEFYRVSWQSTLGNIPKTLFYDVKRNWSGDHCSADPSLVRGIFFSNKKITKKERPKLVDFFPTLLNLFGVEQPYEPSGEDLFTAR